ncbi:hypothetical protein Tco_0018702 [Tanacetum coccineum]
MSHLSQLAADVNSIQLTNIMALLFHSDNQRDCQLVWETYVSLSVIWLAHGLSLDVDDPVDVALAYHEKMV